MKASLLILVVFCLSFGSYTFPSYNKIPVMERDGIVVFKVTDSMSNTFSLYLSAKADLEKNFGSEVVNGVKIEWMMVELYCDDESPFFRLSKDDLSILSKDQVKKLKLFVYDADVRLNSGNWFLPYINLIRK